MLIGISLLPPKKKMAMVKVWERWNDEKRVKEQFLAFKTLYEPEPMVPKPVVLTEEYIPEAMQCLRDWLEKRQAGRVYQNYKSIPSK